jgi:site-specific recombinase XerD
MPEVTVLLKNIISFMKWEKFAKEHSLISLPASPIHVSLYLVFLLDSGATYSTVSSAFYSIKWAHDMCGQLDPTGNAFVNKLVDSAKRTAKTPVVKKDPVSTDTLISLCNMFQDSTDLTVVRDLTMILLCYSAFLRFSELSQLKCYHITVKDDYLVIKIKNSKTDQYRAGDDILVSKGQSLACPYNMLMKYVGLANVNIFSDVFVSSFV